MKSMNKTMKKVAGEVKVGYRLMSLRGAPMVREIVLCNVADVIGFKITGGDVVWNKIDAVCSVSKATKAEIFFESL